MSNLSVDADVSTRRTLRGRRAAETGRFRGDIQALRAIAIGAVVLNHLWPGRLPGGYIGVDVFFVISGYLITAHLLRELGQSGRIRFGDFYARRIRRLLPAAVLVLITTAIAVFLLLPYTRWAANGWQILASGLYVENWLLAGLSVNYSAHNASASAVQHFWSLSVEEQFYLIWPLLLVLAAVIVRRVRRADALARAVLAVVICVGLVSLACSVLYTAVAPEKAYFVTFTRAWQFAAGALVAAAGLGRSLWPSLRPVVALLGYVGIVFAAITFNEHTPYPGYWALIPTCATALVITAGSGGHVRVLSTVTDMKPVQWVGTISYSLYLWHWPLIVVLPFVFHAELRAPQKVLALFVSVALAWITFRLVERPAQNARWWRNSVKRSLSGMIVFMVGIALVVAGLVIAARHHASEQAAMPGALGRCDGAGALLSKENCDVLAPVKNPVVPEKDLYWQVAPECADRDERLRVDDRLTTRMCDFSKDGHGADVWLVGDSHAEQWQAPVFELAREFGWKLTISQFSGCPVADVKFGGFREGWAQPENDRCMGWARDVRAAVLAERPALVFTSMTTRLERANDGSGTTEYEQYVAGLSSVWREWAANGTRVAAISDVPFNADVRPPDCVVLHADDVKECARPRESALPPDPIPEAVRATQSDMVTSIDLSGAFCDERSCYAAVGGMPVYSDNDHLSAQYAKSTLPWFREPLEKWIGALR